jgi:hypothetical protein
VAHQRHHPLQAEGLSLQIAGGFERQRNSPGSFPTPQPQSLKGSNILPPCKHATMTNDVPNAAPKGPTKIARGDQREPLDNKVKSVEPQRGDRFGRTPCSGNGLTDKKFDFTARRGRAEGVPEASGCNAFAKAFDAYVRQIHGPNPNIDLHLSNVSTIAHWLPRQGPEAFSPWQAGKAGAAMGCQFANTKRPGRGESLSGTFAT